MDRETLTTMIEPKKGTPFIRAEKHGKVGRIVIYDGYNTNYLTLKDAMGREVCSDELEALGQIAAIIGAIPCLLENVSPGM